MFCAGPIYHTKLDAQMELVYIVLATVAVCLCLAGVIAGVVYFKKRRDAQQTELQESLQPSKHSLDDCVL